MAKKKTKQYVCGIRLMDKNYNAIPAGMPFKKIIMVKSTFDTLLANDEITEVVEGVRPAPVIRVRAGKALAVGLPQETPDKSINPPVTPGTAKGGIHTEETANPPDADEVVKDKVTPATPGPGADAPASDETKGAAKIWTYDPKSLVDLPMQQLLDTLQQRCTEFKLDLTKFKFTEAPKLREFLSSEFGK